MPSGFWQIAAVDDLGTLRVAVFIMEQTAERKSSVIDHLTTVDIVEQRTGLDFFWQMSDADEDAMESTNNVAWATGWVT